MVDRPFLVFALSLVVLWLAEQIGGHSSKKRRPSEEGEQHDRDVVRAEITKERKPTRSVRSTFAPICSRVTRPLKVRELMKNYID